jgi:methylated-DNA-[protein]-cysteine S-methyltransferase
MKIPHRFYTTFPTPLGKFSVAVDATGAVIATAFGGRAALQRRGWPCQLLVDNTRTGATRTQLREYFAGQRSAFDLRLAPEGTVFQQGVWAALREIPYGETRSYGELARHLGSSPRAVGRANATNPICLIVPCHRVIGANGSLTGYAFGEKVKGRLLALEGSRLPANCRPRHVAAVRPSRRRFGSRTGPEDRR